MGRDHHPYAFTTWMAGGGVKPGMTYGASDDLGINAAQDRVRMTKPRCCICWALIMSSLTSSGPAISPDRVHGKVVKPILDEFFRPTHPIFTRLPTGGMIDF